MDIQGIRQELTHLAALADRCDGVKLLKRGEHFAKPEKMLFTLSLTKFDSDQNLALAILLPADRPVAVLEFLPLLRSELAPLQV